MQKYHYKNRSDRAILSLDTFVHYLVMKFGNYFDMLKMFQTAFRTIPTRMAGRVTKEEGRVLLAEDIVYIGLLCLGLSVLEFTCRSFFS